MAKVFDINFTPVKILVQDIAFDRIRNRDKIEGKPRATKELLYVYNICDYNSSPNREGITDEQELHSRALRNANLDINFKIDKAVIEAMKAYLKIRDTSVILYIKELYISAMNSLNVVREINALNKDILDIIRASKTAEDKQLDVRISRIRDVTDNSKRLTELAQNAEKDVVRLKSLLELIKSDDEVSELAESGAAITDSMRMR